jgi:hypothetical protein
MRARLSVVDAARELSALSNAGRSKLVEPGMSVGEKPMLRKGLTMRFFGYARDRRPRGAPGIWIVSLLLVLAVATVLGVAGITDTGGTTANGARGAATTSVKSQGDTSMQRVKTPADMAYISPTAASRAAKP